MHELLTTLRRLRGPGGCPWDAEQTHASLRPYLLEEAAEAVDAIGGGHGDGGPGDGPGDGGWGAELAGELGDVLLQVAFHSVIAEEEGSFSYADVEGSIVQKLVRRHPHVFGDVQVGGSAEVVSNWQAIKAAEQGNKPRRAVDRVPSALGALAREGAAQNLAGVTGSREELEATLKVAPDSTQGVAGVLAAAVAWARSQGVDPELALRDHTTRTLKALPDEAAPDGAAPDGAAPDKAAAP